MMIRTTGLGFFLSLLLCVSSVVIPQENLEKYASPRIVLLGDTGVGKSSVALTLLGINKTTSNYKRCFEVGLGFDHNSNTKEACEKQGHLFGNTSEPMITVIDTPGWAGADDDQLDITEKIVEFLSKEIQYVHTFAYLYSEGSKRKTTNVVNSLRLIKNIFEGKTGNKFVANVVLVATHWGHFGKGPINEKKKEEFLDLHKGVFRSENWGYTENIKAVFYAPLDQEPEEADKEEIRNEMRELVTLSQQNEPFHCKDIVAAMFEISIMKDSLKEAKKNLTETRNLLEQRERDLESTIEESQKMNRVNEDLRGDLEESQKNLTECWDQIKFEDEEKEKEVDPEENNSDVEKIIL